MLMSCVLTSIFLQVFLILFFVALRVMLFEAGGIQIFFVTSTELASLILTQGRCNRIEIERPTNINFKVIYLFLMDLVMLLEIGTRSKFLSALFALIRFISCVDSLMSD